MAATSPNSQQIRSRSMRNIPEPVLFSSLNSHLPDAVQFPREGSRRVQDLGARGGGRMVSKLCCCLLLPLVAVKGCREEMCKEKRGWHSCLCSLLNSKKRSRYPAIRILSRSGVRLLETLPFSIFLLCLSYTKCKLQHFWRY